MIEERYSGIYEADRMRRYASIDQRKEWSHEDIVFYYKQWNSDKRFSRQRTWDEYCDVRDGFPLGTNASLVLKRNRAISEAFN